MTPETWERVKEIFESALEVPSQERPAFLDRACAGHSALREEVERLLRSDAEADGFLNAPLLECRYSLSIGEVIGARYEIMRLLGRGGMGEVYEAKDRLLGERIALKTLRSDLASNQGVLRRFQREIQFARKVTHPNVCRVFEVGVHELPEGRGRSLHFFTMQLLEGETLAARIRRTGRLSKAAAFSLALQLAEGLQAAHAAGVIHRDFKSGNVILTPASGGERAVITDFGLALVNPAARANDSTATITGGQIVGTLAYMSPEQLTGGAITTASDIYSFGIVLYEMATGHVPFDDRHLINAAVQRASGKIPGLRNDAPDLDPHWESAIVRCLQPDPKRRFRSAADLADRFREGFWRIPQPDWTRRQWAGAVISGVLVLSGLVGSWYWTHRPYQPNATALSWYEKGVAGVHATTYEAAKNALEQAIAADPNYAPSYSYLAVALDELEYTGRARDEILEALAVLQKHRHRQQDILHVTAAQYTLSRNFELAQPAIDELASLARGDEKPAAALEQAMLAVKRDRTPLAISTLESILRQAPAYAGARLRLAFLYARQRKNEAALESYQQAETLFRAANNFDGVVESLFQRGVFFSRANRNQEAISVMQQAFAIARDTGDMHHEIRLQMALGTAYANLGQTSQALEAVRKGIQQAEDNHMENAAAVALLDLGNVYFVRGEENAAERYFEKGLEFAKQIRSQRIQARAMLSLGSLRVQYDRPQEALPYIQSALPFYQQGNYLRETTQGLILLGTTQGSVGQLSESERTLRQAVAYGDRLQDPEQAGLAHGHLAEVLRSRGSLPEALVEQNRALQAYASSRGGLSAAFGYAALARIQWRLGQYPDAIEALSKAKTRQQAIAGSQSNLKASLAYAEAELEYSRGHWPAALGLARQALEFHGGTGDDLDAQLLIGLSSIRMGNTPNRTAQVRKILQSDQEKGRNLAAALGQLALAEAQWESDHQDQARELAEAARAYFEPQEAWESVWQCQRLLSGSVPPVSLPAVQQALERLRQSWPRTAFESYISRPDLRILLR